MTGRYLMVLVAFLLLVPVICAQASGDSAATAGTVSASDTHCLPNDTNLTTVKDHFNRLACGFEQPLDIIQTFGAPAVTASFSQLFTSHDGFSSDASGYGRHYGVNLLAGVSSKVLGQFLLPTAFHQDDRYKHTKTGTPVWGRIGNILKHVIVTQSADGSNGVFNVSALPNSLLSAALSNTYQPKPQRAAAASAQRFGWNLFGFSAGDAFAEFRPDLLALGGKVISGIAKLWPWHK